MDISWGSIKKYSINISIFLISICISWIVGQHIFYYIKAPADRAIPVDLNNEYSLSFYNHRGQRLSGAEGMLKLIMDPFTIYSNYPNQQSMSYSINIYGFRDSFPNNNHQMVMLLGGSAAFGFALNDNNKTFASIINRTSSEYQMVNGAVIGYLSGQELSQMIHYLDDFRPSVYVVFNGWNDIYDPYAFAKTWPVEYGPIGFNNAFFMIEGRLAEFFQMTREEKHSKLTDLEPANKPLAEEDFSDKVISTYTSNVSKMHSFATSRSAKFLLIFQPELGNKKIRSSNEEETLNAWISKYGYGERKISQRYKNLKGAAKKYFEEKYITYIDMNDEPEFSENPQTLFFDVVHPNDLGHETLAKIIDRALLDKFR